MKCDELTECAATIAPRLEWGADFPLQVLEKLGRMEAKIDMIVGNGQPGRMRLAEDRITALERNDIQRSVYDRIVTAAIAFAVSAVIALHDHFMPR